MELNTNSLAFIGLCNEFCHAVETAVNSDATTFVGSMVRLLPRIYISALDLAPAPLMDPDDEPWLESYLDEETYEDLRGRLEQMLGAEDVYLEVFEEDMKYSETPIGASVAEGVCDIYQVLYNFIASVKDAPMENVNEALVAVKRDFAEYWSQKLVNLMRPLNNIHFSEDDEEEEL